MLRSRFGRGWPKLAVRSLSARCLEDDILFFVRRLIDYRAPREEAWSRTKNEAVFASGFLTTSDECEVSAAAPDEQPVLNGLCRAAVTVERV